MTEMYVVSLEIFYRCVCEGNTFSSRHTMQPNKEEGGEYSECIITSAADGEGVLTHVDSC